MTWRSRNLAGSIWWRAALVAGLAVACLWPIASLGQDQSPPPPPPQPRGDNQPPRQENRRPERPPREEGPDDGRRGRRDDDGRDNGRRDRAPNREGQDGWLDDAWIDEAIRRAVASGRMPIPVDDQDPVAVARWLTGLRERREQIERKREELVRRSDRDGFADRAEAHRLAEQQRVAERELRQDGFAAVVHLETLRETLKRGLAQKDLSPERREELTKGEEVAELIANRPELLRELRREIRARHQRGGWGGGEPWQQGPDGERRRFEGPDGPPHPPVPPMDGFPPGPPGLDGPFNGQWRDGRFDRDSDGWDGPDGRQRGPEAESGDAAARALRREGIRARMSRTSSTREELARLEDEVGALRDEVAELRAELKALGEAVRAQADPAPPPQAK